MHLAWRFNLHQTSGSLHFVQLDLGHKIDLHIDIVHVLQRITIGATTARGYSGRRVSVLRCDLLVGVLPLIHRFVHHGVAVLTQVTFLRAISTFARLDAFESHGSILARDTGVKHRGIDRRLILVLLVCFPATAPLPWRPTSVLLLLLLLCGQLGLRLRI